MRVECGAGAGGEFAACHGSEREVRSDRRTSRPLLFCAGAFAGSMLLSLHGDFPGSPIWSQEPLPFKIVDTTDRAYAA
jgi:hypothetical protein